MKSKVLLAVAAALSLGACVAPDMDYDFERGSRHEHRHEHRYDNRDDNYDRKRCAVKSVVMKKTVAHQSPAVCALSLVRTDCLLMSAT